LVAFLIDHTKKNFLMINQSKKFPATTTLRVPDSYMWMYPD
jgi:hypothetical protein